MSKYMLQNQQECSCNQCSTDPYFKIENCFHELVTEVQKANARYNLGIADEWNLKWGNITGFVENQKDLAQYLDSFIIVYKQEITQAINDLQDKLESKIQEQVDLLEEDRRKIEDLINSLEEFKQELRDLVENSYGVKKIDTVEDMDNLTPEPGDIIYINETGQLLQYTKDSTWNSLQTFYIGDTEPEDKSVFWLTNIKNSEYKENNTVVQALNTRMNKIEQLLYIIQRLVTEGVIAGDSTTSTRSLLINSSEEQINPSTGESESEIAPITEGLQFTVPCISIKNDTGENFAKNWQNLIDCELLWINDEIVAGQDQPGRLYIYTDGNFIPVGSGVSSGGGGTISATNIMKMFFQYLGLSGDDGKKYRIHINSSGELQVYNADNAKLDFDSNVYGQVYVSHYLQINSIYCGGTDKDEYSFQSCSHNFVELSNNGTEDISLNGLYLLYKPKSDGVWQYLELKGEVKAGSTFLIRGARCSIDTNTTIIQVPTYDMEWRNSNGRLIQFAQETPTFYLAEAKMQDGALCVYGNDNQLVPISTFTVPYRTSSCYKGYVDSVGIGTGADAEGGSPLIIQSGDDIASGDLLFVKYYSMDPVQQANKAYASRKSSALWTYINLQKIADEGKVNPMYYFPDKVKFHPKSSSEHKNIFSSKSVFDSYKPNMINITFGRQATETSSGNDATRCFNWISVGYYDEFIQYRVKGVSSWTTLYSITSDTSSTYSTNPDIAKQYERIRWITTSGVAVTTHKVILKGLTSGTYEYRVGREGDEDYYSKVKEFTVRKDSDVTSFTFVQTSDQQGFNWLEYQAWKKASYYISKTHPDIHFTINTGDITQNGNRESEWLDYYDGRQYLENKEEMFTIGNNDLCGKQIHQLGTGAAGTYKVNHVNITFYYCYELDDNNPAIFTSGDLTYYMPSLYSYNYGKYHFVSINSEIALNTYSVYQDTEGTFYSDTYRQMEDWFQRDLQQWTGNSNPTNCGKCIVYMHEMPFTIITHATVIGTSGRVGSKLNTAYGKYRWSRLFKKYGIRLVMGGHKHTYSITKPVYDAPEEYITSSNTINTSVDLMGEVSADASMKPVVQVQRSENKPKSNMVRYEVVDKITAPTYVMCQATGYKLVSNQEIPCRGSDNIKWLLFYFSGNESGEKDTANGYQYYPTYILYNVTDTSINVKSYQVKNIYTNPTSANKGGAFNINNQIQEALSSQEILKTSSQGNISGYGTQFDDTEIINGLTITL